MAVPTATWCASVANWWDSTAATMSGGTATITKNSDYWRCQIGGTGSDTGSKYARIRYPVPERTGSAIEVGEEFFMGADVLLPTTLYSMVEGYHRPFAATDNIVASKLGGGTVGHSSGNEWRFGCFFYSDQKFRILSTHETGTTLTLYTGPSNQFSSYLGSRLHIVVRAILSTSSTVGEWELFIDDESVAGATAQTIPSTVEPTDRYVTRIVGGIDGGNAQDGTLYYDYYELKVGTEYFWPPEPPPTAEDPYDNSYERRVGAAGGARFGSLGGH